jgi:hypothetical protein
VNECRHTSTCGETVADSDSENERHYSTSNGNNEGLFPLVIDAEKNCEPLRPGDVIIYSHPLYVAGSKEGFRRTQFLKTDPTAACGNLLYLDNGEFLQPDTLLGV